MKQPEYTTAMDALKGMLAGSMKYNVWNKLIKRELYQRYLIKFPEGYGMGEDMTIIMLFAHAKKIKYISSAFYHYVKLNTNAFSQTYSQRHLIELKHNTLRIVKFIQNKFGHTLDKELAFFKLEVKFPLLITGNKKKYKLWKEWYPEANHYILQKYKCEFSKQTIAMGCLERTILDSMDIHAYCFKGCIWNNLQIRHVEIFINRNNCSYY